MASLCQVAIIGAGPYGLSAAAYLRAAQIDIRVFGEPMDFWRNSMPRGMLLRSPWRHSQISDPRGEFTLDRFAEIAGLPPVTNMRVEHFLRYGEWFQRQVVPDVDRRMDYDGDGVITPNDSRIWFRYYRAFVRPRTQAF